MYTCRLVRIRGQVRSCVWGKGFCGYVCVYRSVFCTEELAVLGIWTDTHSLLKLEIEV